MSDSHRPHHGSRSELVAAGYCSLLLEGLVEIVVEHLDIGSWRVVGPQTWQRIGGSSRPACLGYRGRRTAVVVGVEHKLVPDGMERLVAVVAALVREEKISRRLGQYRGKRRSTLTPSFHRFFALVVLCIHNFLEDWGEYIVLVVALAVVAVAAVVADNTPDNHLTPR